MKLILAIVLCACAINTSQAFGLPSLPSMPSPCTALEAVAGEAVEFIGGCISANVSIIPGGAAAVDALTKKAESAVVGAIKSHCRRADRRELGLMGAACHTAIGPLCSAAIKAADVAAKAALVSVGIPTVVSGCILATLEKQLSAKCTGLCRRRAFGLPSLPHISLPSPCTALEAVAGEAVEFIGGCIS